MPCLRLADGQAALSLPVPAQGVGDVRQVHQQAVREERRADKEGEVKAHHVVNGDTIYIRNGEGIFEVCCDCHLAHLVIYRIERGRIAATIYRDDAATRRLRKRGKEKR